MKKPSKKAKRAIPEELDSSAKCFTKPLEDAAIEYWREQYDTLSEKKLDLEVVLLGELKSLTIEKKELEARLMNCNLRISRIPFSLGSDHSLEQAPNKPVWLHETK